MPFRREHFVTSNSSGTLRRHDHAARVGAQQFANHKRATSSDNSTEVV
jgi:hypothetical protein